MARQLVSGKAVEVYGLQELQDRILKLKDSVAGDEAQAVLADIAQRGAKRIRAEAQSQHWPYKAIESVFAYTRRHNESKVMSTLCGIRKRGNSKPWAAGYVEWGKRTGKLLGESLATMYEYGTSKLSARPAMRPVMSEMRSTVPKNIADGYRSIIERATTK